MSPLSTIDVATDKLPTCIVYPTREQHTATVFFLHGLGDTAKNFGHSLYRLTNHLDLGHVKFVLPTAPMGQVTANNGITMPTWFDCYSWDIANRREDEAGLYRAATWLNKLIAAEQRDHGIPSERIIIAGISQGGAVAILAAMTRLIPIGGLIVLSSYVPLRKKMPEITVPQCKEIPVFWGHGEADPQVPELQWREFAEVLAGQMKVPFTHAMGSSRLSRAELVESGMKGLRFRTYSNLGHWFDEVEIKDVATWISAILSPDRPDASALVTSES